MGDNAEADSINLRDPQLQSWTRKRLSRLWPVWYRSLFLRVLLIVVAVWFGWRAGLTYRHMCTLGSRAIENAAMFGTLILCMLLLIVIRRYWLAIPFCIGIILLIKAGGEPYVEWAHSPNFPWHSDVP